MELNFLMEDTIPNKVVYIKLYHVKIIDIILDRLLIMGKLKVHLSNYNKLYYNWVKNIKEMHIIFLL